MSTIPACDDATVPDGPGADNALLAGLSTAAPDWSPCLDIVTLRPGDTLVERGARPASVYFPIDCVLSMLTVMRDGRAAEFATAGREGCTAATEILTGVPTPVRVITQVPGKAARIPTRELVELVQRNTAARALLERYTQSLFVQVAQIAACNRLHPVEERCARWLLMTHDRVGRDDFLLTQELLSQMLGVRRARVNVAAGILQKAGLIRYTRGRIRITDRRGLEAAACECYAVISREREQLLAAAEDGRGGPHGGGGR